MSLPSRDLRGVHILIRHPSGHTAAACALYGAVAFPVYLHSRRRIVWLLLLMPVAVGLSRMYRGMHHHSDVVAGLVLGALAILIAKSATAVAGGPA